MKMRSRLAALLGAGALVFALFGVTSASTPASDQGITPTLHTHANITLAGGACGEGDGIETGNTSGSGSINGVSVAWTYNSTSRALAFVATGGLVTVAFVKGGDDYNEYDYSGKPDGGVSSDGHLYAPDNASGKPAGLSHAVFCTEPGEQQGPEEALIVTEVHLGEADSGDAVVVDNGNPAPVGGSVHDSAVLAFTGDIELPDESSVTFYFFENGNCSGEPADQSDPIDVSGETSPVSIDPGLVEGPLDPGSYSFMAVFSTGNSDVVGDAEGDCEPFAVFTSTEEPATDVPDGSLPNTATIGGSGTSSPSDSSWLLVAALGVLLASVVVMTPVRVKTRR